MKTRILIAFCIAGFLSFSCLASPVKGINASVLRSFHSVFPNATHVEWYTCPSFYCVSFRVDEQSVRAFYDENGSMTNAIRYSDARYLPLNIIYQLKKRFPHKTIKNETEVCNGNDVVYFIRLDDLNTWRIVKSDEDGYFTTINKFEKNF